MSKYSRSNSSVSESGCLRDQMRMSAFPVVSLRALAWVSVRHCGPILQSSFEPKSVSVFDLVKRFRGKKKVRSQKTCSFLISGGYVGKSLWRRSIRRKKLAGPANTNGHKRCRILKDFADG